MTIPLYSDLKTYNKRKARGDIFAGFTIAIITIPQAMAYAMIAGVPPIHGLYAAIFPMIIYAIFGTARKLAVGPIAILALLTGACIGGMAPQTISEYIVLSSMLAIMVGLLQLLFGLFRLGFVVNFLSPAVISGFTSAAAIIIGFSQIKHLLGLDLPRSKYVHEVVIRLTQEVQNVNWVALLIGALGMLVIFGSKRIHKSIPGSLIAVLGSIVAVWGLGLSDLNIAILGDIPRGLPRFEVPMVSFDQILMLSTSAFAIALVGFMESYAVGLAVQKNDKSYEISPNRELCGLGLANISSGFFQGFPTSAGFARTVVYDQSGGRTGLGAIISAVFLSVVVAFFTPLFYHLPNAILASVIMMSVLQLVDIGIGIRLWRSNRGEFWTLLVTFLGTLGLGIEQGIGLGVILSLVLIIYHTSRPHVAILGPVPGTKFYRNVDRFENIEAAADLSIIRFDARLYFANIQHFKDVLSEQIALKKPDLRTIIINAESMNNMDGAAVDALKEIVADLRSDGIELFFASVHGPVRDVLKRSKLDDLIGCDNFFMNVHDAVNCHHSQSVTTQDPTLQAYTMQSNYKRRKRK